MFNARSNQYWNFRAALVIAAASALPVLMCSMVGCQSGGSARGPGSAVVSIMNTPERRMAELTRGQWVLRSVDGQDIAPLMADHWQTPHLEFAPDGGVTGLAGVNRISGKVDPAMLSRGEIDLGQLISTKMAGPPGLMRVEHSFTGALTKARTFSFTGPDTLMISGPDAGSLVLERLVIVPKR